MISNLSKYNSFLSKYSHQSPDDSNPVTPINGINTLNFTPPSQPAIQHNTLLNPLVLQQGQLTAAFFEEQTLYQIPLAADQNRKFDQALDRALEADENQILEWKLKADQNQKFDQALDRALDDQDQTLPFNQLCQFTQSPTATPNPIVATTYQSTLPQTLFGHSFNQAQDQNAPISQPLGNPNERNDSFSSLGNNDDWNSPFSNYAF
jgi:hypothetical protein